MTGRNRRSQRLDVKLISPLRDYMTQSQIEYVFRELADAEKDVQQAAGDYAVRLILHEVQAARWTATFEVLKRHGLDTGWLQHAADRAEG